MTDSRVISYVIGTYPSLTTTFIDRELAELVKRGFDVRVVAVRRPRSELSEGQRELARRTEYVLPVRPLAFAWTQLRWLVRRPLTYLGTLVYVLRQPHDNGSRRKSVAHLLIGAEVARRLEPRRDGHLHAHFADRAATVALVASRLLDIRYSLTAHANDIYLAPTLLPAKIGNSIVTVTCTDYNERHLRETLEPGVGSRVRRIYHGLELEGYTSIERDAGRSRVIVSVGQLKQKKGLRHLIEAVALLRDRGVDVECRIIGEGPLRDELQGLIASHHVEDRVTLLGALPHPAVVTHYREARAFALPCVVADDGDRDGIPNAILEAMASGLPVISTPISGIPEAVRDGETGLLVEPGDAAQLADALERVVTDDRAWRNLGSAARSFVIGEFEISRNIDRFLEAIDGHG